MAEIEILPSSSNNNKECRLRRMEGSGNAFLRTSDQLDGMAP